ncbi:hypothetical protein [Thioclava kandeliae]|uniref:Uncharacterized protein n=1 Tax=Thioclava kandeliae TaxID=3070818 RepID=A0ABV1SID6_9RHOB
MKGVEARHRASIEVAWVTAALSRAAKLPPLEKLFPKPAPSAESAAMLRAEMRAHANTTAKHLPKKRWSEWLKQ